MIKTKTSTTWQLDVACDVCKEAHARKDEVRAEYDALDALRRDGWLFATIEVDHWRIKIAICPGCSPSHKWLADIIEEHSPEARRLRSHYEQ
jgi:hypothetical protein